MHKAFWLGLIGGILGLIVSLLLLLTGYVGDSLYTDYAYSGTLYLAGSVGLICSILGMVGGCLDRQKPIGAALMIGSGLMIFVFTSLFGLFTCIFFVIGGALLIRDHFREQQTMAAYPYQYQQANPGQPFGPAPYPAQDQAAQHPAPGTVLFCPRCGEQAMEAGQRYCQACGKKLE